MSIEEVSAPEMSSSGDVLVAMRACGLCGSDLEKIYGEYAMKSGRLGHEPAGEIIRVGDNVKGFSPGDRVFMHHHVPCYSCHYCNHGDYTMCPRYQESNITPCGLAETVLVPEWNVSLGGLIKLRDEVTYEDASLIEPLACCIRGLEKSSFQTGDDILVAGAGPAGLMQVLLAKLFGASKVFVTDTNKFRREFAHGLGASAFDSTDPNLASKIRDETSGRGVDLSIVATGNPNAISQCLDSTRRGGKVLIFGVPPKGIGLSIDMSRLYSSELSLIPTYAASEKETNIAMRLIENHRINLRPLITHKFSLQESREAVICAHEAKDAVKVVVTNYS